MPSNSMYDVTAEIQIAIDPRSKIEAEFIWYHWSTESKNNNNNIKLFFLVLYVVASQFSG